MKKALIGFMLILFLVGCSTSNGPSLSDYEKAFEDAGMEDKEEPMYVLIGAKDGFMFYKDGEKVAVYEFNSEKDIEKAEESLPDMKEWERNGLMVLETNNAEAKKIFTELE